MRLSPCLVSNNRKSPSICRVLKKVDLVSVRGEGQQHLYAIKAGGLKPIHDWVQPFEQLWNARFDHLDAYLKELQAKEKA